MANNFSLSKYYELLEKGYNTDEILEYFSNQSVELVGWYDHIAEFADVRAEKDLGKDEEGNPIYQHIRFDGTVFQSGTPVNAENLGQMEWNDLINALKIDALYETVRSLQVQLATVMGQNLNGMPFNTFVASAKNINSELMILEGWYDEANGRGVV